MGKRNKLPSGTVTFLFTDIEGSTELLKQLGDRYAQLLADQRRILREVFSRWGGHEVDTQGDAFFVSFPRATDALFAVVDIQQALAQHAWPEGVEVRVRMGLHTGEPLAETEGYVGIDVHRAARIASVGHGGQILLSETTSSLVRDALPPDVQLQELGRHRLKDISRPEGISQLIVAGLPAQFPPLKSLEALPSLSPVASLPLQLPAFLELEPNEPEVFVGRENELEALDRYLQRAIAGEGQMAFLEGGAGSGKSALLGAFAREAACRYPQLLIGCGDCTAYTGSGDPYLPFREALDMLAGNLEAPWRAGKISSDSARTIWEAMTDVVHAIVEDGPDLLSILLPGREVLNRIRSSVQGTAPWIERLATLTDRAQEIPQDPEAVNLFGQVERVLTRCSQASPILIMLDDLQWVDSASVGLLFHLGRNLSGKRIFILGAFRPEEVTARRAGVDHPLKSVLAEFRRLFGDICIDLAQTSEVEGLRFIDELIDHEPNQLDQEFRRTLFLHTAGHPLFTIELLRALTERGEMYRDDQRRWIAASSLDWNTLPEKVDGVIAERIGRLDPNLIETLTVASVEGESFTAQVIARVRGIAEREVLTQLSQELERSHRLVREKGEEQINGNYLSRYQFSHVLFQRYLYSNIGKGQRRLLHGEIARSLEDLYREDPERIALQLGFHYEHAGEDEHAVRTLVEAGDLARRRFGIQEAIDCYQRALSICQRAGELPLSARLQMKLGQAYLDVHEYQAAQLAYEEGFKLRQHWRKDERQADLATPTEVMRIAYHDPLTLDPSRTMEVFSGCALRQLFSGLVECTHNLEIVPDLAESWQVTDGGCRYVFNLRGDARWSNGEPVTALDAEFSLKRILDPATRCPSAESLSMVKGARPCILGEGDTRDIGIAARDEKTLTIELEKPTSYFLYLLASHPCDIVPRKCVEKFGSAWTNLENVVTCGPFTIQEWVPGEYFRYVRNTQYHGPSTGNLREVWVDTDPDPLAQLKRYVAGELDVFASMSGLDDEGQRIMRTQIVDGVIQPKAHVDFIAFYINKPPLSDPRVVQALILAVDRSEIMGRDSRFIPGDGLIPPGLPGHTPGIGPGFDRDRARKLLAEAGFPDGSGFPTLIGNAFAIYQPITEFVSNLWRRNLGIQVRWEYTDQIEVWQQKTADQEYDLHIMTLIPTIPDPVDLLYRNPFLQVSGWRSEEFEHLTETAERERDPNRRIQLYAEANRVLTQNEPFLIVDYMQWTILAKPWVAKYPISSMDMAYWKDVVIDRARE